MQISARMLDKELPAPARAHGGDAGLDLAARQPVRLEPGARATVPTGLALAIPDGYAGLVVPRSGLAARHGIGVVNAPGLIDTGYRGEVAVILVNHGHDRVAIRRGDRIAQLVIVPIVLAELTLVDDLPPSGRGDGGFGSSGT